MRERSRRSCSAVLIVGRRGRRSSLWPIIRLQTAGIQALQDWNLMPAFIDRQVQSFLNFMYLGRLLKHPDGFAADAAFQADGQPVFDFSTVYF